MGNENDFLAENKRSGRGSREDLTPSTRSVPTCEKTFDQEDRPCELEIRSNGAEKSTTDDCAA